MEPMQIKLTEINTKDGKKWMKVDVSGGTEKERKKQLRKTLNDLKEFDERRWWHFWTWEWIDPIFRMLKKA